MDTKNLHFETLQLHAGQEQPDPATDARAVPIYQTTSYVFRNSAHAAARFALQEPGNIYGRLTNPTQGVFEQRVAALEGGVAGLAVASGAAAVTYAFENITRAGDHIVAAKTIYGGTYNLLAHTLPAYGVTTTFVDPSDLSNFEKAIQENTKAVFIETLGNPNSNIIDIEAVAEIAHRQQNAADAHDLLHVKFDEDLAAEQGHDHLAGGDDRHVDPHASSGKAHIVADRFDKQPCTVVDDANGAKHHQKAGSYYDPPVKNAGPGWLHGSTPPFPLLL